MILSRFGAGARLLPSSVSLRLFGADRFAALHVPSFRCLWLSGVLNGVGGWLAFAAQAWLLLELTAPERRPHMFVLFVLLRTIPRLLFSLPAGALSDRCGALRVLRLARFGDALPALLIVGAAVAGHLSTSLVLVAAFVSAAVNALDKPADRTLVHRYAPGRLLVGGVALGAVSGTLAAITGPLLLMGVQAVAGLPWAFAVLVLLAALSGGILLRIDDPAVPLTRSAEPVGRDCWVALRYLASAPVLIVLMVLANSPGVLDRILTVLMPTYASGQGSGPGGLTLLLLAPATGALLGGSLLAWIGGELRLLPLALGSSSVAVVSVGLLAVTPFFALSLLLFLVLGAAKVAFSVAILAALQRRVPDHARGRLLAL